MRYLRNWRNMENKCGYEVEIPIFLENGIPKIRGIYGIQNGNKIFYEDSLSYGEKRKTSSNYKYYDFEQEIDSPQLIESMKKFALEYDFSSVSDEGEAIILEFVVDFKEEFYFKGLYMESEINFNSARSEFGKYFVTTPKQSFEYVELLLDVVSQTDEENWDYFSEDLLNLTKDFLEYGYYSRVLMIRQHKDNKTISVPVGYIQVRLLKDTAPNLLYKDLYNKAGLSGVDLWEKANHIREGNPIYIDVIAIKKKYQNNRNILKMVPEALQSIISEIKETVVQPFDIYAVGVTDEGRKMCRALKMLQISDVVRRKGEISHTRTLFKSNLGDFEKNLNKIMRKNI